VEHGFYIIKVCIKKAINEVVLKTSFIAFYLVRKSSLLFKYYDDEHWWNHIIAVVHHLNHHVV